MSDSHIMHKCKRCSDMTSHYKTKSSNDKTLIVCQSCYTSRDITKIELPILECQWVRVRDYQ